MQLAARIEEVHVCPLSDGPAPHVGGPVVSGSPDVLVGESPAARVTDFVVCVGPPDVILKGAMTVFVNNLPFARMGDLTAHAGAIATGFPNVLVGDVGMGDPMMNELLSLLAQMDSASPDSGSDDSQSGSQPLQGQVEMTQPPANLQSQTASQDQSSSSSQSSGADSNDSSPSLSSGADDNQFIATASDSDQPNPLKGLPDGTLLAMNPSSGSPGPGNSAPQNNQPSTPLQGKVSQNDPVTLDQMTNIYPLPPAPKPPKPLTGKISKTQQAKFNADQARYDKQQANYDKRVAPLKARLQAVADLLNDKAMTDKYNLQTPQRKAAFLGQLGAETSGLQNVSEKANPWSGKNFINYETGKKGKELGNTQPGDGEKYRGRGPFQLTGRNFYTNLSKAIGVDTVNNPDLVAEDPKISAESAAWYWKNKQTNLFGANGKLLSKDPVTGKSLITGYVNPKKKTGAIYKKFSMAELADRGDMYNVSHAVNPATLSLSQRLKDSAKALKQLTTPRD